MRNALLEEMYSEMAVKTNSDSPELITEEASPEQLWVDKSLIKPLSLVITNFHNARAEIPSYISRADVQAEVNKLEGIRQRLIEIWHDIGEVHQSDSARSVKKESAPPAEPDNWYAPNEAEATERAKRLMQKHNRTNCFVTPLTSGKHSGEWVISPERRSDTSKEVKI